MPVSETHSQILYAALKANGIRLLSAPPETWLVHLVDLADRADGCVAHQAGMEPMPRRLSRFWISRAVRPQTWRPPATW